MSTNDTDVFSVVYGQQQKSTFLALPKRLIDNKAPIENHFHILSDSRELYRFVQSMTLNVCINSEFVSL